MFVLMIFVPCFSSSPLQSLDVYQSIDFGLVLNYCERKRDRKKWNKVGVVSSAEHGSRAAYYGVFNRVL